MSKDKADRNFSYWRTYILPPFIAGAIASLFMQIAGISAVDAFGFAGRGLSRSVATVIGVLSLSASIGLLVLSLLPPRFFFKSADAQEICWHRGSLISSGLAIFTFGGGLSLLAAAPGEVLVQSGWKPFAIVALFGTGIVMTLRAHYLADELGKRLSGEAAALSFAVVALGILGWGIFAYLGYGAGPAPLDLVSLALASHLLGKFVAMCRRGLINW